MRLELGARTVEVGATAIELSVAPVTVSGALPVTPPNVALMLAVPAATPSTIPAALTVAAAVLSETQVALDVMTCVLPSLNCAVAVNPSLLPGAIECPDGVTVIVEAVAFVTVSVTDGVKVPIVAVIAVGPALIPLAKPFPTPIVATVVSEDVHVACPVRFLVLPSLNVPTAVNCCVVLRAIEGLTGFTTNDARLAAFTVREVLPLIAPEVAEIVTVPSLRPVVKPLTVMDAMLLLVDAHVTVPVMSWVVASLNVPVAVNCCCTPSGIDIPAGVTAIETRVALVTVRLAVPDTEPTVALIVVGPAVKAIAVPFVGTASLTVATLVSEELHVAVLVMLLTLPSE